MKHKILITIPEFTSEAGTILTKLGQVDYRAPLQKELSRLIGAYEVVVTGLGLVFDRDVLRSASRLVCIATPTTGLDHIDLEVAKEKGIAVISLRDERDFLNSITGTAELAWGLVLSLARRIPEAEEAVRRGRFDREAFRGHELSGKTMGIVGLGRLGTMVARYAAAFGMRVLFTDPNVSATEGDAYKRVSFDELLAESDVVSIHVHLDDHTKGMFNERAFKMMKSDALLVNTSRGGIVDEKALLESLRSGHLGGYGADVLADELTFSPPTKIPPRHPLVAYANDHRTVLLLPHIGGMTVESRAKTDIFIAKKLRAHLEAAEHV
ncbi:MAG: NAD(P)-dependent oxidoreductase [bacterium]|nr:NAD(P)-dependent oxidoreductase [bacterium]